MPAPLHGVLRTRTSLSLSSLDLRLLPMILVLLFEVFITPTERDLSLFRLMEVTGEAPKPRTDAADAVPT